MMSQQWYRARIMKHDRGQRAKKSVDKDKKIGKLKSRFSQNEITLEEYVRGISAHTAI